MPPQDMTPQYDPREQAFIDTLNAAPTGEAKGTQLSSDRKQSLWDAYHYGSNEKEWIDKINTTSLDPTTKQDLYNFRFKGIGLDGKQLGVTTAPHSPETETGASRVSAAPAPRASAIATEQAKTNGPSTLDNFRQLIGKALPDGSEGYLSAANKLFVEPFEKLAKVGGEAGAATVQGLITGRSPYAAEARAQLGTTTPVEGVARGVGSVMGSVITDPRQWPLMGEGAAKMALGKWISRGFALQMGKGTYDGAQNLYNNWDKMTPGQRAEAITSTGLSGAFTTLAASHGMADHETGAPPENTTATQKGPEAQPSEAQPKTATSAAKPNPGVTATVSAPAEAHSDQTTAIRQTNSPVDFRGRGVMRPWDPDGTRFSHGGTIGMDKMDLSNAGMEPVARSFDPKDVIAPEPSQATQGANYRPQYTYKPSEKAATMSAKDVDRGPEFNAQSFQEEINRNGAILRNSKATPEDVAVASDRLRDAKEGLSRIQNGGKVTPEDIVAPKIEDRTETAVKGPIAGGENPEALASAAGLQYKGELVKDSGVHQFEDPSAPGKTMAIKSKDLSTPDALRGRMDDKLKELSQAPDATTVAKQPVATSFDLPKRAYDHIDKMVQLSGQMDRALTDKQREDIETEMSATHATSVAIATAHINDLSGDKLLQLRDKLRDDASRLDAQGNAIRDLTDETIKNRAIKGKSKTEYGESGTGIAGMRAEGRKMVNVEDVNLREGNDIEALAGSRKQEYDPSRVMKRSARAIFDEMQGRVPTSDFDSIKVKGEKPNGVSQEEWEGFVNRASADRADLKKKITDHVMYLKESGQDIDANNGDLKDLLGQLKDVEDMFGGKFDEIAKPGRKKNVAPSLDGKGAIQAPEALKSWTYERAKLALGTYLRQIPTDEEFYQHADARNEKALHLKNIADQIDGRLAARKESAALVSANERGSIGEVKGTVQGAVSRTSLMPEDIKTSDVGKRAARAGIKAWPVNDDKPSGYAGWLSPDGKVFVDKGAIDHDEVAQSLFPEHRNPSYGMLNAGWVRKVTPTAYEAWRLDSQTTNALESDLIRGSGLGTKWGEDVLIDTRNPMRQGIKSIHIDRGWSDLENAILKAKHDPSQGWNTQSGRVGGIQPLAGSTAGMVAGAAAGYVAGGPHGAMVGAGIGWGAGFLSPAILRSPLITNAFHKMIPIANSFGVSMKDWLVGVPQEAPLHQEMVNIINAQQRDVAAASLPWVQRLAQVPGNVYTKWSNTMFPLSDRPGALIDGLAKYDTRGQAFRDMKGQLSVDESPFTFAMMAMNKYSGQRDLQVLAYRKVIGDAASTGTLNHLRDYLNLKGYQRVWDVMNEKMNDATNDLNNIQTKLKSSNLGIHERVGLEKERDERQANVNSIQKRMASNDLTPENYDPQKINAHLGDMQSQLKPDQWAQVQSLAQRVFKMNRDVLDNVHKAGIISDNDYNTFIARGNEYIPMQRILENISAVEGRTSGTNANPLYLRQQNIIRSLSGSDKVNRDPLLSSADANTEAMREIVRNDTIGKFLDLATKDPNGVGAYFKPVQGNYSPKMGESLVGHYKDGKVTTYLTPGAIGEALKNANPVMTETAIAASMRLSSRILRDAATGGNLAWALPNAARHLGDMALMSKAGLDFTDPTSLPKQIVQFGKAYKDAWVSTLKKDTRWQEMIRSGAAYGALQRNITPEMNLSLESLGFAQKVAYSRVIDKVAAVNRTIEDVTKLTAYSRLRQAGETEHAAAYETKRFGGGPDFSQMGTDAPTANLAFMFFNAHLRYVGRAFERVQEEPGKMFAMLGTVGAMATTLLMYNLTQKDEKGNYLLRKVPYNVRENNFVIMHGNNSTYESSNGGDIPYYTSIPKPSVLKFLWNPVENAIGKLFGSEERTGTELGLAAVNAMLPGQGQLDAKHPIASAAATVGASLNPAIKAPLEELANKNFSAGNRPIVPNRLSKVDPAHQYTDKTPEIYKRMGQGGTTGAAAGGAVGATIGAYIDGGTGAAVGGTLGAGLGVAGISPLRLQHMTNAFTAGVGRTTATLADKMLRPDDAKQPFPYQGQEAQQQGVTGAVAGRFIGQPVDQQELNRTQRFYDNIQAASVPEATLQQIMKTDPKAALVYMHQNKDALFTAKVAPEMVKRIGELDGMTKEIQARNTSDDAKLKELKAVSEEKQRLMDLFNRMLEKKPVGSTAAVPGGGMGNGRP